MNMLFYCNFKVTRVFRRRKLPGKCYISLLRLLLLTTLFRARISARGTNEAFLGDKLRKSGSSQITLTRRPTDTCVVIDGGSLVQIKISRNALCHSPGEFVLVTAAVVIADGTSSRFRSSHFGKNFPRGRMIGTRPMERKLFPL